MPPHAIHAEQGGPTRSVAIIVRSQKLGQGTVLQGRYDPKTNIRTEGYGPTQVPYELVGRRSLRRALGASAPGWPLDVGQPCSLPLYRLAVPSRCASRSCVTRIAPVGDLIRDPPGGARGEAHVSNRTVRKSPSIINVFGVAGGKPTRRSRTPSGTSSAASATRSS